MWYDLRTTQAPQPFYVWLETPDGPLLGSAMTWNCETRHDSRRQVELGIGGNSATARTIGDLGFGVTACRGPVRTRLLRARFRFVSDCPRRSFPFTQSASKAA